MLTDGGCRELDRMWPSTWTHSDRKVIDEFLRSSRSVSFVLTLSVIHNPPSVPPKKRWELTGKLIRNQYATHQLSEAAVESLCAIPRYLPDPVLDARNAARDIRERQAGPQHVSRAGPHVGDGERTTVKISARTLTELLAGRISHEAFIKRCRLHETMLGADVFERLLSEGQLISDVKMEKRPDLDDDHIVLTFEWDAAAAPYRGPEEK